MGNNSSLRKADKVEFDEYYTQYEYIQKEINAYLEYNPNVFKNKIVFLPCDDPEWSNFTKFFAQNFEKLELKKLISTSYALEMKEKNNNISLQISLFESESPKYNPKITKSRGKIFKLDRDTNNSDTIDFNDIEWEYLNGDGDFRSDEVKKLRDEADIIITNPPFSLFRQFINWLMESKKLFLIIGNQNSITYKEVFPYIKNNQIWLGATCNSEDMVFAVPEGIEIAVKDKEKAAKMGYVGNYTRLGNSCWFTNIDHGRRHQPLELMTMEDNIRYSKHKNIKNIGYKKFDNFNAINIPFTDSIPKDYLELMGVPISFLYKYNPEQFEIIDALNRYSILDTQKTNEKVKSMRSHSCNIDGTPTYFRIIIKKGGKNK